MTSLLSHVRRFQGQIAKCFRSPSKTQLAVGAAAFVAIVLLSLQVHMPILALDSDIGVDEGYAASVALRMVDGSGLPYVEAVSHRGPGYYWTIAAAWAMGGAYDWNGFRGLAFGSFLASVMTMFLAGWAAKRPLTGAIGAGLHCCAVACAMHPDDGIGLHAEHVAVPWLVGSLAFAALAARRTRKYEWFVAFAACSGATAMAAGLMKQTLLVGAGPMGLWILAESCTRTGWTLRQRAAATGAFVLGWLAPGFLVLAIYGGAGEVSTLWYWFWQYNADVFANTKDFHQPWRVLREWFVTSPWWMLGWAFLFAGNLAVLATRLRPARRALHGYAESGFFATVTLLAAFTMFAAGIGLRLWPHYFVVAIAMAGMLVGCSTVQRFDWRSASGRWGAAAATLLVVVVVALSTAARGKVVRDEQRAGMGWKDSENPELCAFIDEYSDRSDPLFVWGFDGDLYVDCERQPASRYVFMTMIVGTVPPFWGIRKPEYVAPGAVETLVRELESSKPPVLVEVTKRIVYPMESVPLVDAFVHDHYRFVRAIPVEGGRKARCYVRRDLAPCTR